MRVIKVLGMDRDDEIPEQVIDALLSHGHDGQDGTVLYPLNEQAMAEQHRHERVINELNPKLRIALLAVSMLKRAILKENVQWRENMIKAHPEFSDYSFTVVGFDKARVNYRKGQPLMPGDRLAPADLNKKPPAWVDEMMQSDEFKNES